MKGFVIEVFNNVVGFINTGSVTLDIKTLLETCHIAGYFQIDRLQQLCLDHFTYNLNRKTLELPWQLKTKYSSSNWMHSCLDKRFEERAVMFRGSGKPSVTGLYFLQDEIHEWMGERKSLGRYLRMFNKKSGNLYQLEKFTETTFYSLHRFHHMLCWLVRDGNKVVLFQHHLVSGNISKTMVVNEKSGFAYDKYTICSNSDKLFVIGKTVNKKSDKCSLSLSAFKSEKFADSLSLCGKVEKLNIFLYREYTNSRLWFSHFYDEKIYVFYSCYNRQHTASDYNKCNFNELYLLVICSKSLKIWRNKKLSAERGIEGVYENVNLKNFEKMFFCQNREKLYIKIPTFGWAVNPYEKVLVFDMKYHWFYFTKNFLPSTLPFGRYLEFKFALGTDGTVYGIRKYNSRKRGRYANKYCTEFRAFHLRNDKLVDQGQQLKIRAQSDEPEVMHACFV